MLVDVICRDAVDHAANSIAAVEKCGRPLNDLHAAKRKHVNWFYFVSRLRSDAAETQTILQHQHSVAIKAANDRASRTGTETTFGNAELAFQGFTDGHGIPLREFQSANRIDRLIRCVNRLSRATRGYDHFFANGRQQQLKINTLISAAYLDALNYVRHAIQMSDDLISTRRHIGKLKRAVFIRQHRSLQLSDRHDGIPHWRP